MNMKKFVSLCIFIFLLGTFIPESSIAQRRKSPKRYSYKKGSRKSSRGRSKSASRKRSNSYARKRRATPTGRGKGYSRYRSSSRISSARFSGSNARNFSTVGINLNAMNYFGDLSPSNGFGRTDISFTRPGIGVQYAYQFSPYTAVRAAFNWGRIRGDDANQKGDDPSSIGRRNRSLSFRNAIKELSIALEINLFAIQSAGRRPVINPYLVVGGAIFHHQPQAKLPETLDAVDFPNAGEWINLKPLGTEGQNHPGNEDKVYSNIGYSIIPIGLGVKFVLPGQLEVAAEFSPRITFTDYLDDVSTTYPNFNLLAGQENGDIAVLLSERDPTTQYEEGDIRGGSEQNDFYFISQIRLSYILPGGKGSSRAKFR